MKIVPFLQQHLGFTRSEVTAIFVLGSVFFIGLTVRWYRDLSSPAEVNAYDYRQADSLFMARSRSYVPLLTAGDPPRETRSAVPRNTSPSRQSIRLNTASGDELERLPGVGAATARLILAYRQAHGRFASLDELLNVKGIGPKKLERMRPFLILD